MERNEDEDEDNGATRWVARIIGAKENRETCSTSPPISR
jgi:hypothetical protein